MGKLIYYLTKILVDHKFNGAMNTMRLLNKNNTGSNLHFLSGSRSFRSQKVKTLLYLVMGRPYILYCVNPQEACFNPGGCPDKDDQGGDKPGN